MNDLLLAVSDRLAVLARGANSDETDDQDDKIVKLMVGVRL